jgi:uncharacterized protein (DUF1800 family)
MKPFTRAGQAAWWPVVLIFIASIPTVFAGEINPAPPRITIQIGTNGPAQLAFPYPAALQYNVYSAPDASQPFLLDTTSGRLLGPSYEVTNGGPNRLYRVSVTPMSSNDVFSATVLNRVTYGPRPEDIERIQSIGPQAFINEQLAWDQVVEDLDTTPPIVNAPYPPPTQAPFTNWIRVSATGTATATNFTMYLSTAGQVYIDNVVLVAGAVPDQGPNLLLNGDFEDPVLTNGWFRGSAISANSIITNSPTVDGNAPSGTNCLLLISSAGTTTITSGLWQPFSTSTGAPPGNFTLSFSYLPVVHHGTNVLTVRLSGSLTIRNVTLPSDGPVPPTPVTAPYAVSPVYSKLTNAAPPLPGWSLPPLNLSIGDLRAYHVLRAVQSKRQLYEIMVQFFDNHFSTEYTKIKDWFDNNTANAVTNDAMRQNLAVDLEWREHSRWRQALLNTNCTFHDLLKISVESPAMIIYLDTIQNTRAAPNENYAREVLELHTMGADNGYVQQDIVELARVWTGWHVTKKDASNANNPLAPAVTDATNLPGLYVLNFRPANHTTNAAKRLFTNVVVSTRFPPPWGGQSYGLTIATNQYPTTNGITEGYLVAQHLANLPQTMEFVSVKLCRTFVHENFEFNYYDYNAPDAPPEAQLIRQCMTAWDTPAADGRKGNIRKVLSVILNSSLFRSQAAAQQKIKTPLELAVSAIRALRLSTTDTNNLNWVSMTADTDGYGLATPLSRMGGMNLFAKTEPDGYSEKGSIWLNTANLCERYRYVQHLLMPTTSSTKDDDYGSSGLKNTSDPVKLLKSKLPASSWNDAGAVADYFLGLLFPGEGAGNLGADRADAINFLNTADNGSGSPFANVTDAAVYDGRVRGLVGTLMSLPQFQEQ